MYEIIKDGYERHSRDEDTKYSREELRDYDIEKLSKKWWEGTGKYNAEREAKGLPTGFVDSVEKSPINDLGQMFYETNKRSQQLNNYIDKENHFYEKFKQLVLNDKSEFKQFSKLPTIDDKEKFLNYFYPYEKDMSNKYDIFSYNIDKLLIMDVK